MPQPLSRRQGLIATATLMTPWWLSGCRRTPRRVHDDDRGPEQTPRRMIPLGDSPGRGAEDPLVTVVLFSDFRCKFCWQAAGTMEGVLAARGKDVRLVFKHRPGATTGPKALPALAAEAAHRQGKFWPLHDLLMHNPQQLEDADLRRYAGQCGLDLQRFQRDFADPSLSRRLESDREISDRFSVPGTPCFFLNGRRAFLGKLEARLAEELGHAEGFLRRGTPRGQLYAAVTSWSPPAQVSASGKEAAGRL